MAKEKRCKETANLFGGGVENLEPGKVPKEYLDLLFSLTKTSEKVQVAVIDYLCAGISQMSAAEMRGVNQAAISRQVKRLESINKTVCELVKYHR